ncbi:hypothetical protein D0B54_15900 [Solimonas sp. K1W22B-7]|uniref:hypothetical protein n=1 Tax=Solimonas sp. K1W22B-7 TaxID=2303331 RepID=UPI000E330F06|nr:hypothetical protein [Solimonas sp. K1W22B-7]AXQ30062.1 hypothetical protein D0B54_15900 [Solimonas sp. K1W22B-7]
MFLRSILLAAALLPFAAPAADCLRLQTKSLGEMSIPLPAADARAARQKIAYAQQIEVPAERCVFQGGNRQCSLRSDKVEVGFTLEREGDDCRLVDSHVVGGSKRTVGGRKVEVPEVKEDKQRFDCSSQVSACR